MSALGVRSARLVVLLLAAGACGRGGLHPSVQNDAAADANDRANDAARTQDTPSPSQPPVDGQSPCSERFSPCGKGDGLRCHDLSRSQNHCGACGRSCAAGISCNGGVCGQYRCKGSLGFKTSMFKGTGDAKALGDFDGDGILDLVGVPEAGGLMSLLYGAGDGTFPTHQVIDSTSFGSAAYHTWQGIAADVDGDGWLDLISVRGNQLAVTVRRGSGSRHAPFQEPSSYPTTKEVFGMLLADFDGDGRGDLVAGVTGGLDIWLGAGGSFDRHTTLPSVDDPSSNASTPVAIDWNSDGFLDLAYGSFSFGGLGISAVGGIAPVRYRLGRGDGTFDAEVTCALNQGVFGDLDRDGRPDLISATGLSGATLLLGIDGCHASKVVPITDWTSEGGMVFADLDGDGNLDVVADSASKIIVRAGDGRGAFDRLVSLSVPSADPRPIGALLPGDLNRDGKLDILFARRDGWGAMLNTCQ